MIELPWVDQELASEIALLKITPERLALAQKFKEAGELISEAESRQKGRELTDTEWDSVFDKAREIVPGGFEVYREWEALNNIAQFEIDGFNLNNGNQDRLL